MVTPNIALLLALPALVFGFSRDEAGNVCLVDPTRSDIVYHAFTSNLTPFVAKDGRVVTLPKSESSNSVELSSFSFEKPQDSNYSTDVFHVVVNTHPPQYLTGSEDGGIILDIFSSDGPESLFRVFCNGTVRSLSEILVPSSNDDGQSTSNTSESSQTLLFIPTVDPETITLSARRVDTKVPRCPKGYDIVERPGAPEPFIDGCPSDIASPIPQLDFDPCCTRHDYCYGKCDECFETCNKDFEKCMKDVCRDGDLDFQANRACKIAAKIYGRAVQKQEWKKAFLGAGNERCNCCKDGECKAWDEHGNLEN
ncbi:hypothetical protein EJ05DRAFT_343084 [Pseudovirgaria hyperparasitica]|uniref:Phospholipase A2 n=1 Tax=Pseudovirgaria hyperparasitica TaxID=470096 RepID=A0A6A6W9J3_9PEZI|nr:uncharacterized protein EJ05DRAFT_343084 [Pseudovirgaria hyperparasitica]KAF2759343.1 hypothetical protein EJ05DRAFT_343084 [Pseudovirgaria hyperparasitica]